MVESADEFMEVSPDCVYVSVQSTSVVLQQQHAYIGASVWPAPGRDCRASQRYVDGQPVEFETPCARTGECVVDFIYCNNKKDARFTFAGLQKMKLANSLPKVFLEGAQKTSHVRVVPANRTNSSLH